MEQEKGPNQITTLASTLGVFFVKLLFEWIAWLASKLETHGNLLHVHQPTGFYAFFDKGITCHYIITEFAGEIRISENFLRREKGVLAFMYNQLSKQVTKEILTALLLSRFLTFNFFLISNTIYLKLLDVYMY